MYSPIVNKSLLQRKHRLPRRAPLSMMPRATFQKTRKTFLWRSTQLTVKSTTSDQRLKYVPCSWWRWAGLCQFVRQCELVMVEDILPFFPDSTLIDNFKEVRFICPVLVWLLPSLTGDLRFAGAVQSINRDSSTWHGWSHTVSGVDSERYPGPPKSIWVCCFRSTMWPVQPTYTDSPVLSFPLSACVSWRLPRSGGLQACRG